MLIVVTASEKVSTPSQIPTSSHNTISKSRITPIPSIRRIPPNCPPIRQNIIRINTLLDTQQAIVVRSPPEIIHRIRCEHICLIRIRTTHGSNSPQNLRRGMSQPKGALDLRVSCFICERCADSHIPGGAAPGWGDGGGVVSCTDGVGEGRNHEDLDRWGVDDEEGPVGRVGDLGDDAQ